VNLFEKHLNVPHEKLNCGFPNCLVTFYKSEEIRHLTSAHGYPQCGVCRTTSKGVKWFLKHIMACQDPLVQCGLCSDNHDQMPKSELREHVVTHHGFPSCPKCLILIGDNEANFIQHVSVCTVSTCGLCSEQMPKSELREHVVTQHGFPSCPTCLILIDTHEANFIRHVSVCTVSTCGLCSEQMPKSEFREHVLTQHGFPSCPNCSISIGDNEVNFIRHVSMCGIRTNKQHTCLVCNMDFETRYLYDSHVSGECVPPGSVSLSYEAYAKLVHGMPLEMVFGNLRMRAVWDLSAYCPSLMPVRQLAGGIPLRMESAKEVTDREASTDNGFGGFRSGPYEFAEDPRIFQKGIFSVVRASAEETGGDAEATGGGSGMSSLAWLFRLMGTPWEVGGNKSRALLPDHRLCLVDYFRKRPACDVWIYLISRFDKYRRTVEEINEVKGLMTSCELPVGVVPQYRDMEFVRVFCENMRLLTEESRFKVTYTTGNNDRRCVVEEVSQLSGKRKRGVFLEKNLPVKVITPVAAVVGMFGVGCSELFDLEAMDPLVNITTLGVGGSDPPQSLAIDCKDALKVWGLSERYDVLEHQVDTGAITGPATFINVRVAALTAPAPQVYAKQQFEIVKTRDWFGVCWEVIYMVYRDFVTYFVATRSFGRLRLFSNFANEKPSHVQLEELLFRFRPFIIRDLQVESRAARAEALFYGLNDEARILRCLLLNNLKVDRLRFRALQAHDTNLCQFQAQSVHRFPHRVPDSTSKKSNPFNYGKPYNVPMRVMCT